MSTSKLCDKDYSACCGGACEEEVFEDLSSLKINSGNLTGDKGSKNWLKRSAARGMLRAAGFSENDFEKPLIGVATPFTDVTPCNNKMFELFEIISKESVKKGLKPYFMGSPVITDGESMGMEGMKYSLPSRDLIADSYEMMMEGYACDGVIALSGCDKTIPASLMPLARRNAVGITLYGGSILPGEYRGKELNIVSIFEAIGAFSAGKITKEEMLEIEKRSLPGSGSCGGMYTANTMATAIEALGMALPFTSSNPATDSNNRISESKFNDCVKTVKALKNLLKLGIKTRDILTKKAFENALTVQMALTGSTNGVLHLLALAKEAEVDLTLDDFERINQQTPIIADLKPSGKYVMYDLYKVGGLPVVMKELLETGLIHGDCLTVTGKTVEENLKNIPKISEINQANVSENYAENPVLYPANKPLVGKGHHIRVLKGNLCPGGSVFKQSGKYLVGKSHTGPARVFNSEDDANNAILDGKIQKGNVVVIRYEGPKGGPGMREMLSPTSALAGRGLVYEVPLITDGRFSGGSHGIITGHIVPEAAEGGAIALIEEGDMITINPDKNLLQVEVSDEILAERKKNWTRPEPKYKRGVLAKYSQTVKNASLGGVTS